MLLGPLDIYPNIPKAFLLKIFHRKTEAHVKFFPLPFHLDFAEGFHIFSVCPGPLNLVC